MLAGFESFERRLLFSVYNFPAGASGPNPPTATEIGQIIDITIGTVYNEPRGTNPVNKHVIYFTVDGIERQFDVPMSSNGITPPVTTGIVIGGTAPTTR